MSGTSGQTTELQVLADVVGRLERLGIAYMLSGSLAMSWYAIPRMTRDIDLVVALAERELESLRAAFEPDYYVPDALADALAAPGMFNLVHLQSVTKIDVIVRKNTPYRRHEFERRVHVDLGGFRAWLVSREDLILSKLLWSRDTGSEQQRRDIANLLGGDVDRDYLEHWSTELGVADRLKELMP